MVEIFVQPLGALCLIVFHIQAVMDSPDPDHCAWQVGLQAMSSQNLKSSQQKFFDPFGTSSRSHHTTRCDSRSG
jgi:hypothetical protein